MLRWSFYNSHEPQPKNNDSLIKAAIERLSLQFHGYGCRRVTKDLQRKGKIINSKKVLRIMKENNLLYKKKRFTILTTDSKHNLPVYPNLAKGLKVTKLNQLWVSDITYIHLPGEYVYLAVIIDVFSRKCIGWELSRNIDTKLGLNALEMAIQKRKHLGFDSLIHHSYQGVQYASHE